jgi:hypothetical protein
MSSTRSLRRKRKDRGKEVRKEVKTYSMPKQIKSVILDTLRELGFETEVKFEEEEDEEEGIVERFEKIWAYKRLPDLDTALSITCYYDGKCHIEVSRFRLRESVKAERLREAILSTVDRLRQYADNLTRISSLLKRLEDIGFERFGREWDYVEMSKRLNLKRYSYARVYADPEHVLLQLQVEVPAEKIEKLVELIEKMIAEIEIELA